MNANAALRPRFIIALSVLFFQLFTLTAFSQNVKSQEELKKSIQKLEEKVIQWRRDIHQNPELGNRETRTASLIAEHLRSLGMQVETNVAKTGVVGILKGDKPGTVVALRADMDALPIVERTDVPFASTVKTDYNGQEVGVMHACGHDTHVAILMGVAEVLSSMKKDLRGTVKFIFQPAEEGAPAGEEGGAELMVKEGVLENPKPDVIFGLHIDAQTEVGKITYRPGGTMASVNDMKIIVKGRQAHGAAPWDAIDPIVVSAQIVNSLQTVVSRNLNITKNAGIVTIGSIHGGNRSNIIPEEVVMLGTVRALNEEDEKMLIDRVKTIVTKTAEAAGAKAEILIPYSSSYPVTFNDIALTEKMLPSLKKAAGAENVILAPAETGAEDFSFYQQVIPGLYFFLGGMPKGGDPKTAPSHHTPDFFIDESGLMLGVEALTTLTLDFMKAK